jgi:nucleoside-diphosphate-sugar epimerase
MKVLILGGSGHIGGHLFHRLSQRPDLDVWRGSRRSADAVRRSVQVDTLDAEGLKKALVGVACVVNCVAGGAAAISDGARLLADAAHHNGCRVVHLSTMSVYGNAVGVVGENAGFDPALGWYARAKVEAEGFMAALVQRGGQAVVLRPGCVAGPGSELWVGRVGRWLRAGRLGDIGAAGDGWTNLVHVDDVCRAIEACIRMPLPAGQMPVFNLAAPDSPRWSEYFSHLALRIGATPVRRLSARRVRLDAKLFGPPLKILEKLAVRLHIGTRWLPDAMPPALVRFWGQAIWLDSTAAQAALGLEWTPYEATLEDGARWFLSQQSQQNPD